MVYFKFIAHLILTAGYLQVSINIAMPRTEWVKWIGISHHYSSLHSNKRTVLHTTLLMKRVPLRALILFSHGVSKPVMASLEYYTASYLFHIDENSSPNLDFLMRRNSTKEIFIGDHASCTRPHTPLSRFKRRCLHTRRD
jgi:hypothetical protein